jgi:hypothetical protein
MYPPPVLRDMVRETRLTVPASTLSVGLPTCNDEPHVKLEDALVVQELWQGCAIRVAATDNGMGKALCNCRLQSKMQGNSASAGFTAAVHMLSQARKIKQARRLLGPWHLGLPATWGIIQAHTPTCSCIPCRHLALPAGLGCSWCA